MKKFICGVLSVFCMTIFLIGCNQNTGSLEGEWERADASSPLYGSVIKIEKEDENSYVGKIISLTDVAKDAGFRTGDTKWRSIEPTGENNQYSLKDLTINALDGEKSWSDMLLQFNPANPNEIKIEAVNAGVNVFGSNSQTYRRK